MRVLLIGATGLLGRNVLNVLVRRGFDVVCLLRNPERLHNEDVTAIGGDILSLSDLEHAATGCDAVINCAGTTDMSLRHLDDYLPVNKTLCHNIVTVADRLRISSVVHVSTANTVGNGTAQLAGNESMPPSEPFASSLYTRSKLAGERIITDYALSHPESHVVVLNPGFLVGPFDSKPSSGKLLMAAYRRPIMPVPSGGKSFAHVVDVASAVVNALSMGRNGERYLLTGNNLRISDFYAVQASVCGYRQTRFIVPRFLLSVVGFVGDFLRFCGLRTQVSSSNIRQLQTVEYYSYEKAARELDYQVSPVQSAIKDFFLWRQK